MWSTKNSLFQTVNAVLVEKNYELFGVFEEELKTKNGMFLECLKNPVNIRVFDRDH
jgi:hypothetical protein